MAGEVELLPTRALTFTMGHDANGLVGKSAAGVFPGAVSGGRLQIPSVNLTYAGAISINNAALWATSIWSGSATTEAPLNRIAVSGDTVSAPTNQYVEALQVLHSFGGATATGGRHALNVYLNQTASTGNFTASSGAVNPFHVGANVFVDVSFNEGGTDTTFGRSYGNFFAFNPVLRTHGGATNLSDVVNTEFNLQCLAGSSMYGKVGIQIVKETGDAVQGAQKDAAFIIADQSGTVGWLNGIQFGGGTAHWPFDTTYGTLIGSKVSQGYPTTTVDVASYGVDLVQTKFTNAAYRSYNFSVDGGGNVQVGAGLIKPSSTGLQIDVDGAIGTAAAVQVGGENYNVADVLIDGYGGVYRVATVSAGAVATVTVLVAPYFNSHTTPSNPVSTTLAVSTNPVGSGCALNLTWDTTGTELALQPSGGNVAVGSGSDLSTSATTGFLKVPTMAGAPTGNSGAGIALVYDKTNNKLWAGSNGTWKSAVFS